MADIGKAYVTIVPKAPGIEGEISKLLGGAAGPAGEAAGSKAGGAMLSGLKKVATVAAVGKIIKDAFSAGGDLQQSFGGIDTLYGDAAAAAKEYAFSAAQAGISANEYAEQAVSFGAALKAAYGGDTTAAMEAANTAILDMADNSAKLGTPLESIQQAYQGFARGQYQLLDNLKLGYGGSKTEMERLLSDAQKLTGVKYDINNLGNVYAAIHAIQEELGLTGVAAQEAQTTLTGSFNAVKAAWTNVLAGLTTGEGMDEAMANLTIAVTNFADNVLAALGNLAPQVPTLILGLLDALVTNAPNLIVGGLEMIAQIALGFVQAIPELLAKVPGLFLQCVDAFFSLDWGQIGHDIVMGIINGIKAAAAALIETLKGLAQRALQACRNELHIGSPSRLFADEIGHWIPPGIAVGIEANMAPLNTSIAGVAHDITADMAAATAPENLVKSTGQTPSFQQASAAAPVVHISFEGSLAELGRILQPVIKAEEQRRGPQLIT